MYHSFSQLQFAIFLLFLILNSLQKEKIFDMFKLKACADGKINVAQKLELIL